MDKEHKEKLISMLWSLFSWEDNHGYNTSSVIEHKKTLVEIMSMISYLENMEDAQQS